MHLRSGTYIPQPEEYKAFVPTPLPPRPGILISDELKKLIDKAEQSLDQLSMPDSKGCPLKTKYFCDWGLADCFFDPWMIE